MPGPSRQRGLGPPPLPSFVQRNGATARPRTTPGGPLPARPPAGKLASTCCWPHARPPQPASVPIVVPLLPPPAEPALPTSSTPLVAPGRGSMGEAAPLAGEGELLKRLPCRAPGQWLMGTCWGVAGCWRCLPVLCSCPTSWGLLRQFSLCVICLQASCGPHPPRTGAPGPSHQGGLQWPPLPVAGGVVSGLHGQVGNHAVQQESGHARARSPSCLRVCGFGCAN